MAIASGANFQKLTAITALVAHSFVLGGLIDEPAETPPFGSQIINKAESPRPVNATFVRGTFLADDVIDHPASGLDLSLDDRLPFLIVPPAITQQAVIIEEEPVDDALIGRIIAEAEPVVTPQSFLLESNQREDISPELYRRIVVEAEQPPIVPASFLRTSEDIDDIRLDIERKLVVEAALSKAEPAQSFLLESNNREDIEPELYRRIVQVALQPEIAAAPILQGSLTEEPPAEVPPESRTLINQSEPPSVTADSWLHSAPISNDRDVQGGLAVGSAHHAAAQPALQSIMVAPPVDELPADPDQFSIERKLVVQAEQFPVTGDSYLLASEDIQDVTLDIERQVIALEQHPERAPQNFLHFDPIPDAPPDPDQFATRRVLVTEALQPQIPPQSWLLESNQREDVSPELYRRITHKAEPISDAISVLVPSIVAELPAEEPPEGQAAIVAATPIADAISIIRGPVLDDLIGEPFPEENARLIVHAEPIADAHIWLHDTVPPDDVAPPPATDPSAGLTVGSAQHRAAYVQGPSLLQGSITPQIERSVRFVSITDAERIPEAIQATLRHGIPPPDIFVEVQRHLIWRAESISFEPPVSVAVSRLVPDDVTPPVVADPFPYGRHITPFFD